MGHEIENASKNMFLLFESFGFSRKQKMAIAMSVIRERRKKSQKEFSTIIDVSEATYKSIERAEHNISFETIDRIYSKFSDDEVLKMVF